jgi:hypothetical protein
MTSRELAYLCQCHISTVRKHLRFLHDDGEIRQTQVYRSRFVYTPAYTAKEYQKE